MILTSAILLIAGSIFIPSVVSAGTGGVPGGCAFAQTVNGATVYKACVGTNLPMWYPASNNPTYAEGDFPCGTFGNQNCGVEPGDPLNE
jgi:hypothetical protein